MAGEAGDSGGAAAPVAGGDGGSAAPARARIGDLTSANVSPEADSGARMDTGGEEPTLDEAASAAGEQDGEVADGFDAPEPEVVEDSGEPLFGVEPHELLAKLRTGDVPNEVLNQLINHVPALKAFVSELQRGQMRQADYSRKTAETAEVRRQAEGVLQRDAQRWDTWAKDTSAMYDELEQRGFVSLSDIINKRGPLVEIAMHIADTYGSFKKMSSAEQAAFVAEQNAIAKERDLAEKERKIQEREKAYQHQEFKAKHARDLQRMVPVAFNKVKLQDSPLAQRVFSDRLREIVAPIERFTGVTQEMVDAAAVATVETLRDLARHVGPQAANPAAPARAAAPAQPAQRQAGGPPPVAPLNGGRPGTRQVPSGAPKRARIGDFSGLKRGN